MIKMTKKHFATIAVILTAIFFVILWHTMPIVVAGHRPGNIPMLIFYNGLIGATLAMLVVFCLIIVVKREFVKGQLDTFVRFRHLLVLMVKRDFVTRYRRSVLGVLWSVLSPLLTMIVLSMVFSTIFQANIPNFPVYVFSGQLIHNFFSESTTNAMTSIIGGAGTIKKVYVPKYIFPLSKVISSITNLAFAFVAFMLVFVVTRHPFHWTIFLIPIPIIYVIIFSVGIGMLLSAMAVFFRDLTHLYGIATLLLFFLTPIMYHVDILPARIYHLIHLNPLFHYVGYFRNLALYGIIPSLWDNIICLGFALIACGIGLYAKMSQQDKYILYL